MKQSFIIICLFLIFGGNTFKSVEHHELQDLMNFVTQEDLQLEEWQVTIHEKVTTKQAQEMLKKAKIKSKVEIKKTNDRKIYFISPSPQNNRFDLSLSIIVPTSKSDSPEITMNIQGSEWSNKTLKSYETSMNQNFHLFFSDAAHIYTCLIATSNDIISSVDFTYMLEDNLHVKNTVVQSDTIENSTYKQIIYGYVPSWENNIEVLDQRLNIQTVLQNDDDLKTTMIIGTPILMTEY